MSLNNLFAVLLISGLAGCYFNISVAHSSANSNLPSAANARVGNDHGGGDYLTPQLIQRQNPDRHSNFSHMTPPQTSSRPTSTTSRFSSSLLSTKSLSDSIPATPTSSLQPTYVYKAVVPTHIQSEFNKVANALKLSNATSAIRTATTNSSISMEKDNDLSKKIVGSSVVTSVSVILNGNEPEFTDALGQKVPKPQPSLQVASPIDLLNPDRYEFYTFDDNGELVKRLMTIEEIQSIVANGDGDGPTILHHGPIEDRNPEKNVQDIVNSVQSVLNKEVESNKNTSMESLPAFDTPDVSSTWSMILPAIFGNTGSVDIFSHQKPQQIVMTPESEIIETSTKKVIPTSTKKSKPSKRKPGLKRRSTTTTTEMTPQVIQEELDSQESVYTGMQQYQNLAASMQNYDGFSQLHMQPIYHKLPEIETTTRRVFINNQEVVKKPTTGNQNEELLVESLANKPVSIQQKPLPPHRVKKPSGSHTSTKHPQSTKQKRKPTVSSITSTSSTTATPSTTSTTTTPEPTTTVVPTVTIETILSSTTKSPKKKKKPIRKRVNSTTTTPDILTHKPLVTAEKRKPPPHPHRRRPNPTHQHTKYPLTTSATDLTPEGTAHQHVSNIKNQYSSPDKTRPKPIHSSTPSSTTTTVPSTTAVFSPSPTTVASRKPVDISLIKQNVTANHVNDPEGSLPTVKQEETTSASIPVISGTSGYPVPSYDLLTDETENFDLYQYKKQPLSSQNITRNGSQPYQQDDHTLQSFDQIMQTLKYPAQTSEKLTPNIEQSSEKLSLKPINFENSDMLKISSTSKPAHYPFEDATKSSILQDFETTTSFPYLENTSINDNFLTDTPEDITTNSPVDKATKETTGSYGLTQLADIILTELAVKQTESTTEYQDQTQKTEPQAYTTPSSFTEPLIVASGNLASTTPQGFTDQLKMETQLPESFRHPINPILVANLKPQLNMEVINPSEQINMSDFQTHAATVASTLIDGANTLPSDYSNKTNNEIALLLSDVIHQISNNNEDSTKQVTSFNVNRFSNQAQLDLSFLMSPHVSNNDQHKDSDSSFETTKIPETTTFKEMQTQEFFTESEEKFTEQQTTEKDINRNQTESITELNEAYSLESLDESTTSVYLRENDTVTQTDTLLEENPTTMSEPISTTIYYQQQKLENDREPLFEADSSKDTTTLFNGFFEEATTLSGEESLSTKHESLSEEKITAESHTDDGLKTPTTALFVAGELAATETSKGTVGTESATSNYEAAEALSWTTTKTPLSTENDQLGIDVTETASYRITEKFDQEMQTTFQSTTESEKETIVQKNDIEQHTTPMYPMSEETSAELNAMISEEDETDESLDEDPYIKLGETTTPKSSNVSTQTVLVPASATAQPAQTSTEINAPKGAQPSLPITNYNDPYEESDQEDEEDQIGNHFQKQPTNAISSTTSSDATRKTTTTAKPKVITTRRLNTLKPVSYFNKQPAYALYQEPVEPLYSKHHSQSSNTQPKENTPKVATYSIPTSQQRPMQRPPQLSNLMISSTISTRAPVKLDPSPFSSKGLEASLANLDEDILTFAKLCNELAFSYWKSITSEKISSARSLVMSPFALTSMLSMVFLGARGGTSGEMNDVLKLDDMVTFNPHLVFKNITDSVEKSVDREIATTAFVREIYSDRANGKVLQFFKEKTQQLYAGHVEEVNFHVVNDIIRRRTNLLVKRHTMGKVLEYLRTNSVWVNGPLATISANLFQTDCSHGSTQDRDGEIFFQVHPTVRQRRLVPVPAVLFKSGFTAGYEPNLDATVVAFGRIQDTTSMIYVMPGHLSSVSPSDNLDRLEKQLMETAISGNAWSKLLTSLMDRPGMEAQIPRFSHRSFINATTGLQKMGLKRLFKSDYADLGGLTGSSNRDIYLSDMIQINTFSTCGEEKIADHHHVELYPAPPLRKRNKDVDAQGDDEQDSSEAVIDFGSIVQDPVIGRGFYDDLLDPKYLELPLPLRPRQARVPEAPRIRFDKPFLYFVRHNPTGMILFMGRFNPRLLP